MSECPRLSICSDRVKSEHSELCHNEGHADCIIFTLYSTDPKKNPRYHSEVGKK